MISTEVRRSQVYVGTGDVSEYSFPFRVFDKTQVAVRYRASDDAAEVVLDKSQYSVSLQDDALQSAGGSITLSTPLAKGAKLTVLSAIPYTQTLNLRNQGAFNANDLNTAWDKNCALIQQVRELTERAVTVDVTDTMTPSELKQKLLDAANNATIVAKGYAESAKASAEEAKGAELGSLAAESRVDDKAASLVKALEDKGAEQEKRVTDEGDKQVKRLLDEANNELVLRGTACGESAWVLDQDIAAGNAITIHDSLIYLVGRHHLRVSWNGLVLYPGVNFAEIGDPDTKSRAFALTFDAKEGDELDAWIAPLGKKDVADAVATAKAAEEAVAELSRKVVYKNEESAE